MQGSEKKPLFCSQELPMKRFCLPNNDNDVLVKAFSAKKNDFSDRRSQGHFTSPFMTAAGPAAVLPALSGYK